MPYSATGILGQAGDTFSEDCLTINVWTKPQTGEKAKAVMVCTPNSSESRCN
jgi:carboxylesterase type B